MGLDIRKARGEGTHMYLEVPLSFPDLTVNWYGVLESDDVRFLLWRTYLSRAKTARVGDPR